MSPEQRKKFYEYHAKYRKKYYDKHPELFKAVHDKWKSKNEEHVKKYMQQYYQKNKKHMDALGKIWNENNPEKVLQVARTSTLKRNKCKGFHTNEEWEALLWYYNYKCLCCGSYDKIEKDHIVPASKNGTNYIDNMQPLCKTCNCRKKTYHIDYRSEPILK